MLYTVYHAVISSALHNVSECVRDFHKKICVRNNLFSKLHTDVTIVLYNSIKYRKLLKSRGKPMIKKLLVLLMAAVICVSSASCKNGGVSFEPTVEDKKVVMRVGGKDVQYQEYRYYVLNNKRDSFEDTSTLSDEQIKEITALTEENARYSKAIEIMAEKYGAELSKDDVASIEALIAEYRATQCQNDDTAYKVALEEQFLTDYLFRALQQNNTLAYRTIEKMQETGAIKTDDATIDALMASDELLCIKEIYVNYNGEETKDYAKKHAENALESLKGGMSFADAMRRYSSYSEGTMSPEHGYYTTEYEMPEYIWSAAISLAEGEYSVVIESDFGYHIVMRCAKDAEYMEENRDDIAARYSSAMYTKELYETMSSLTVEYTDYGKTIDINAMS